MFVCKECPECGLYSDISVTFCPCGTEISQVYAKRMEKYPPADREGTINAGVAVYSQTCPVCRTEHFVDAPDHAVERCGYCEKMQIKSIEPILLNEKKVERSLTDKIVQSSAIDIVLDAPPTPLRTDAEKSLDAMFRNSEWGPVLRVIFADNSEALPGDGQPQLVLRSVEPHSAFEEVFSSADTPILLGRYASDTLSAGDSRSAQYKRCDDFLQHDGRISSYHCYLTHKDGIWYVHDGCWDISEKNIKQRRSSNSTRVNDKEVQGFQKLNNNDVLKLGNQADSLRLSVKLLR